MPYFLSVIWAHVKKNIMRKRNIILIKSIFLLSHEVRILDSIVDSDDTEFSAGL